MDDLFDLNRIRKKWTAQNTDAGGMSADPNAVTQNQLSHALSHLQDIRQALRLDTPELAITFEAELRHAETLILNLFDKPQLIDVDGAETDIPHEALNIPELKAELQSILRRLTELLEIHLVYPKLESYL